MDFLTFRNRLNVFKVFSLHEVEKLFPDFNRINLVNWQKKGYILKLRNGWYRFTDLPVSEPLLYLIANRIYSPSYISFETSAAWHGLIPEAVFTITSATTLKTAAFVNKDGKFTYKTLKNSLYFGYEWMESDGLTIRVASIEKTLLDLFYIQSFISNITDFQGPRLNKLLIKEKVDFELLEDYLKIFDSPAVTKRISLLKQYLND